MPPLCIGGGNQLWTPFLWLWVHVYVYVYVCMCVCECNCRWDAHIDLYLSRRERHKLILLLCLSSFLPSIPSLPSLLHPFKMLAKGTNPCQRSVQKNDWRSKILREKRWNASFMQNEDKDREKRVESVIKQEVGVRAIRRKGKTKRERERENGRKEKGKGKEGVEWAVAEINNGEEWGVRKKGMGNGMGWDGIGRMDTLHLTNMNLNRYNQLKIVRAHQTQQLTDCAGVGTGGRMRCDAMEPGEALTRSLFVSPRKTWNKQQQTMHCPSTMQCTSENWTVVKHWSLSWRRITT